MKAKQTVFVGLSGGVDSSVAAMRLLRDHHVVGVFIKVWHPDFLVCNWEAERLDAMRVAAQLNIPFLTCDAVEAYRIKVAENMITEYRAGRTPNPDVLCNKEVKFGIFLEFALSHGADMVATGHYARVEELDGRHVLKRGVDQTKDQSYFLWTLTEAQRSRILFPVGDSTKADIRAEAEQAGLKTASKKDSQGICFLGHIDIPEFLSHYIALREGDVLSEQGAIIGRHRGALVYTIGQRHGFTTHTRDTTSAPQYVIAKDLEKNEITVSQTRPDVADASIEILATNEMLPFKFETPYKVQSRYRQTPIGAMLKRSAEGRVHVEVPQSTEMPSAGQSCVIYDGDYCVGGGIIA